MKFVLQFALKSFVLGKKIKKQRSPEICVRHTLGGGHDKIPGDPKTLPIVRHIGLHVEFSSMKSSLDH